MILLARSSRTWQLATRWARRPCRGSLDKDDAMMSRKLTLVAGVLLLATGASCKKPSGDAPRAVADSATRAAGPEVRFVRVIERKVPAALELSGTLAADETSEVASSTGGVVVKIAADVGDRVKKGDVLVQLDARDPALHLSAANAQTAQALARLGIKAGERFDPEKMAEVRAAKEAMDLAVSNAERMKALFDQQSIAAAAWDQARTQAEQARAQYEATVNGARQAYAAMLGASSQAGLASKAVGDASIRAPFDGAVAERRISVGEFAQPGRVVAVVVHDNPLRLRVDVPELDVGKIALGKSVTVSVDAFPGRVFHGVIKRVGASMKAQSRSLPIEAEVPNEEGELKPGFFARASVEFGKGESSAFFVPRVAIGSSGSAARVFVRATNRVTERIVAVGRELDGLVEVRGAFAPTDEVAIDSVDKLNDGVEVKVAAQ
jgi:RND family efflux transporter MFP subunit